MTSRTNPSDIMTVAASIVSVTIEVNCECGEETCHEIECVDDGFGGWCASPQDRFILCETCAEVIDAGLQISVGPPT